MKFISDENFPVNLINGINLIEKSNYKSPNVGELIHVMDFEASNYTDEQIIVLAGTHNAITLSISNTTNCYTNNIM